MGRLDEISFTMGRLEEGQKGLKELVEGVDSKLDALSARLSTVERRTEGLETTTATVARHERLVQRGMGVWMVLTAIFSVGWNFAVDAAKRAFS